MKTKTVHALLQKVKNDYSQIAENFSATRNDSWKEFENFKKYLKKGQTVIDMGCGNGRLRSSLLNKIKYIGVDNNQTLLREAKKRSPSEQFIKGDLLKIPLKNEIADVTFCIATLHHIPSLKLRKKAVSELKRITKKNGLVIITTWNLWQKKYWKSFLKAIFHQYEWNDVFIPWANTVKRYYHAFTTRELKKLLASEFQIIEFFKSGHNFCAICRKK